MATEEAYVCVCLFVCVCDCVYVYVYVCVGVCLSLQSAKDAPAPSASGTPRGDGGKIAPLDLEPGGRSHLLKLHVAIRLVPWQHATVNILGGEGGSRCIA